MDGGSAENAGAVLCTFILNIKKPALGWLF
jgi:hypothetical protein